MHSSRLVDGSGGTKGAAGPFPGLLFLPGKHCALWREELMLAANSATVDSNLHFVLESGYDSSILQEASTSNNSFLGSGI